MSFYPINLDVCDWLCLVVGGGVVASRKIESLRPCGARIRVVSPVVITRIEELADEGSVDWKQREYLPTDVEGAKLVFAATDNPDLQKQIVADATAEGVLVNVIDIPESCTFQVPASFRRGALLFTVATGGGSPALAASIRKELEMLYGAEYEILVALMAELRSEIVASNNDSDTHKKLFEQILASDILNCIKKRCWDDIANTLGDILPPEIDVVTLLERTQGRTEKK